MTDLLTADGWPVLATALLIFTARVADVSLATMRIVFISRGVRRLAPLIGFVEILIWLVALSQVFQHLDRPLHYVAFAGGYAVGTWFGLYLDGKMALGVVAVQIISRRDAADLVAELGERQFGITTVAARGLRGRVRLLYSVIRRRDLARLLQTVRKREPEAFVSVSDVRMASEGYFAPSSLGGGRWLAALKR